ncbi:hypothetical protein C5B42_03820 [Candidatus Cerribacteria bacterium 'Amazon FNV 2010 28 9']|uniref:Uncharacterized protein n=1 Tax=Candidatus Cerribacteria bacterium 'Amazon FNV 2010 28 9' TaxID=2081795 RepID=A0A317JN73_9BACT|nr:MAG: hypothetical protein C5B42_03820 [Candidatus Cerribacteria bacterium 'Amazon FNV 2010 28 9']
MQPERQPLDQAFLDGESSVDLPVDALPQQYEQHLKILLTEFISLTPLQRIDENRRKLLNVNKNQILSFGFLFISFTMVLGISQMPDSGLKSIALCGTFVDALAFLVNAILQNETRTTLLEEKEKIKTDDEYTHQDTLGNQIIYNIILTLQSAGKLPFHPLDEQNPTFSKKETKQLRKLIRNARKQKERKEQVEREAQKRHHQLEVAEHYQQARERLSEELVHTYPVDEEMIKQPKRKKRE